MGRVNINQLGDNLNVQGGGIDNLVVGKIDEVKNSFKDMKVELHA